MDKLLPDTFQLLTLADEKVREEILKEISQERNRQDRKWGYPQRNTLAQWGNILTEELGEFIQQLNEIDLGGKKDHEKFVNELFHVAAVAVAILEHLYGRHI